MFNHSLYPNQPYEYWQMFISNNPGYLKEWGGLEKQEKWGKLCLKALQHAIYEFIDNPNACQVSLKQIYFFFAKERFKIGKIVRTTSRLWTKQNKCECLRYE